MQQLTYTQRDVSANEHPHTMVVMVEPDMLAKYKKDKSVAVAEVVVSYEVLKFETPGNEGKLAHPSKRELQDTFGTTKAEEIVAFMLEHGQLHGKPHTR